MDLVTFELHLETLTTREREVMEKVAMGLSNPQIAEALGISRKTVENTIVRANKRFHGQVSRTEFVRLWTESKK